MYSQGYVCVAVFAEHWLRESPALNPGSLAFSSRYTLQTPSSLREEQVLRMVCVCEEIDVDEEEASCPVAFGPLCIYLQS